MTDLPVDKEIELRKAALRNERDQLKELADQRRSSMIVGITSAVAVLIAALGSQWIAQECPDLPEEQALLDEEGDDFLLQFDRTLHTDTTLGQELIGTYLFHPDTGRVWLGRLNKKVEPPSLEWIPVAIPPNQAPALDDSAAGEGQ